MVLTSHRLDCFRLCMDLLIEGGSIYGFDRVVLLLNGVVGRHLRYVEGLRKRLPSIPWDVIAGPRGRGGFISSLQNACVERYPESLYFKIDEDTFVSPDWNRKLLKAYEAFQGDESVSLFTPVIPNNGLGFDFLVRRTASLQREFEERFHGKELSPKCDGAVWLYPQIADWITRKYLDMKEANAGLETDCGERYGRFGERFSINCICYDYKHWKQLGGVPEYDEVGWGDWIAAQKKPAVLVKDSLVHHYSFFVQQAYLDRTSLLEDLRAVNLPDTLGRGSIRYYLPRWQRVAAQVPGAVLRRLGPCCARNG